MDLRHAGLQADGALKRLDRLVEGAGLAERLAEIEQQAGIRRIQRASYANGKKAAAEAASEPGVV